MQEVTIDIGFTWEICRSRDVNLTHPIWKKDFTGCKWTVPRSCFEGWYSMVYRGKSRII